MTPSDPFIVKQDETESVLFPLTPPRKENPTSPKDASSSVTQRYLRLRARVAIAKTKKRVGRECKLIKTKGAARAVNGDVCHGFAGLLGRHSPCRV